MASRIGFMSLPRELRDNIYHCVIDDEINERKHTRRVSLARPSMQLSYGPDIACHALHQVSRQCRDEFSEAVAKYNRDVPMTVYMTPGERWNAWGCSGTPDMGPGERDHCTSPVASVLFAGLNVIHDQQQAAAVDDAIIKAAAFEKHYEALLPTIRHQLHHTYDVNLPSIDHVGLKRLLRCISQERRTQPAVTIEIQVSSKTGQKRDRTWDIDLALQELAGIFRGFGAVFNIVLAGNEDMLEYWADLAPLSLDEVPFTLLELDDC